MNVIRDERLVTSLEECRTNIYTYEGGHDDTLSQLRLTPL